ncbi:MAG: GGDEF domain-containing protein [Acholeplasmataceae bacterium]
MAIYQYLQMFSVNIFALMMLIVLFIIMKAKSKDSIDNYSKQLLRILVIMNMTALVIEPLTWITDGLLIKGGFFYSYFSNFLLVLLGTSMAGLWVCYVDFKTFGSKKRLKNRFYYMHAFMIVALLLIVNAVTPVFFEINPLTYGYHGGPFKWLNEILTYLVYFYSIVLVYIHRKRVSSSLIWIVLLFLFIPLAGALIQTVYSRLFFSWSTIGIALFMAYFLLETTSTGKDYLTKVYNQQSFEDYTNQLIEKKNDFVLLMFDLDHFKEINDLNGHLIGDLVLTEFANGLLKVFSKQAMVARLGGDEFIVVHENCDQCHIEDLVSELKNILKSNKIPQIQTLSFSYGFESMNKDLSFDDIYFKVDQKMYQNKSR